jgi:hypothetical protein
MHRHEAVFDVCEQLARHSAADGAGSHRHISGIVDIRGVPHVAFSELISINELKHPIFDPAPKARCYWNFLFVCRKRNNEKTLAERTNFGGPQLLIQIDSIYEQNRFELPTLQQFESLLWASIRGLDKKLLTVL